MLRWYPSVLLQIILELTFAPIAFFSIFAVHAFVDHDTPWAIGGQTGSGMSQGLWTLPLVLALGWAMLTLGWRGAKTIFKYMLVVWHLAFTTIFMAFILQPGDLAFRGESVGFAISIEWIGPVFSIVTLLCTVVWLVGDVRAGAPDRSVSPLQSRNKIALVLTAVGICLTGVAYWLDYDQLGTITGIGTALTAHEAIRPLNPSKELHRALLFEGSAPR